MTKPHPRSHHSPWQETLSFYLKLSHHRSCCCLSHTSYIPLMVWTPTSPLKPRPKWIKCTPQLFTLSSESSYIALPPFTAVSLACHRILCSSKLAGSLLKWWYYSSPTQRETATGEVQRPWRKWESAVNTSSLEGSCSSVWAQNMQHSNTFLWGLCPPALAVSCCQDTSPSTGFQHPSVRGHPLDSFPL